MVETDANDVIAELQSSPICTHSHAFYAALITAAQGDASAAFHWAARSVERRDHIIGLSLRTSSFDLLRANGSFEKLLRMMNVG